MVRGGGEEAGEPKKEGGGRVRGEKKRRECKKEWGYIGEKREISLTIGNF